MSASARLPFPPTGRSLIRTLAAIAASLTILLLTVGKASAHPPRAPAKWVNGPFARCVRHNESHDGQDPNAHGNLYGVQDASGGYAWAQHVPRARQDYIAWRMFLRDGDQPWRPYDGCHA